MLARSSEHRREPNWVEQFFDRGIREVGPKNEVYPICTYTYDHRHTRHGDNIVERLDRGFGAGETHDLDKTSCGPAERLGIRSTLKPGRCLAPQTKPFRRSSDTHGGPVGDFQQQAGS